MAHALSSPHHLTVSTLSPCAMTEITLPAAALGTDHASVLYRAITPYKLDDWRWALSSTGLTHSFLNLLHDITYSTPIGNPPPLTHIFIPSNLKSANIDLLYMDKFI